MAATKLSPQILDLNITPKFVAATLMDVATIPMLAIIELEGYEKYGLLINFTSSHSFEGIISLRTGEALR